MIGIYKITNKINDKVYIGQSNNMTRRWHEHVKELEKGLHHSYKLQEAYNEFSITDFKFEVIEVCRESELLNKEKEYISRYRALEIEYGYNVAGTIDSFEYNFHREDTEKYIFNKLKLDNIKNVEMQDKVRFIYLSMYSDKKGILRIDHKNKLTDKLEIFKLLKLNETKGYTMYSNFIKNGLLKETKDGIVVNKNIITRIYENKNTDKNCLILYKIHFKDLYNNITVFEHKTIHRVLILSDYCNYYTNSLCTKESVHHDDLEEMKPIKLKDIIVAESFYCADKLYYFKDKIFNMVISGEKLACEHNGFIYINPKFCHKHQLLLNRTKIENIFKAS